MQHFSRLSRRTLMVCGVACALSSTQARAQEDEARGVKRVFSFAKPATVMIQANFHMVVSVPDPKLSDERMESLKLKVVRMVRNRQIAPNRTAITKAILSEMMTNLADYLIPMDSKRDRNVNLTAIGSGFIVSPKGYVVTNAHVVAPDEDTLKKQLTIKGLSSIIAADVREINAKIGNSIPGFTEALKRAATIYYLRNMRLSKINKRFYVDMGTAVPGVAILQQGTPAEIVTVGEEIPGKDVAILKMEKDNLPTLALGDDTTLDTGDHLYVVGYPGAATFHAALAESSQVEPTLTDGVLSAKKKMRGGWTVLQTSADMTHGNSGGPVMDAKGRVVGIATFGSTDAQGREIAGLNFVVPITVVRQFLDKMNIQAESGTVSKLYTEALDLYDKDHFKTALAKFQDINTIAPGDPTIQAYVSKSQKAIIEGRDKSWQDNLRFVYLGVPVLLLGALGGAFALKNKKRPVSNAAPINPGVPPQMPHQGAPQVPHQAPHQGAPQPQYPPQAQYPQQQPYPPQGQPPQGQPPQAQYPTQGQYPPQGQTQGQPQAQYPPQGSYPAPSYPPTAPPDSSAQAGAGHTPMVYEAVPVHPVYPAPNTTTHIAPPDAPAQPDSSAPATTPAQSHPIPLPPQHPDSPQPPAP